MWVVLGNFKAVSEDGGSATDARAASDRETRLTRPQTAPVFGQRLDKRGFGNRDSVLPLKPKRAHGKYPIWESSAAYEWTVLAQRNADHRQWRAVSRNDCARISTVGRADSAYFSHGPPAQVGPGADPDTGSGLTVRTTLVNAAARLRILFI
ncbi:unnamed protein product, partial [Iphiclides podalirius]